jgi:HlyD family secretion protein
MKNIQFLFLTILLFSLASCKKEEKTFDASGMFETVDVIVSAETGGKLLRFDVSEGADLTAAQNIGEVDCANLSLQKDQVRASMGAISEKKNDAAPQVQIVKEQLNALQGQIAVQSEQLRVLEKEKLRVEKLVKADAIPSKQLDDISGQIDILRKQMAATQEQSAVYKQQMESQEKTVSIQNKGIMSEQKPLEVRVSQIDDQLKRCAISNPINGTVMVKYVNVNEVIAPGKPLYKIADLSTLTLRAYMSGSQLSQVKVGQEVKVLVDAGADKSKTFTGNVTWISDKAEFTPKTIQTKEERANLVYAMKIEVKNDGYLKVGMYGEVLFK